MSFKRLTAAAATAATFTALVGSASATTIVTDQECYTSFLSVSPYAKFTANALPGQPGDNFLFQLNGEDKDGFDPFIDGLPAGYGNYQNSVYLPVLPDDKLETQHTISIKKAVISGNTLVPTDLVASKTIRHIQAGLVGKSLGKGSATVKVKRGKAIKFTVHGLNANVDAKASITGQRGTKKTYSKKVSFGKPKGDCRSVTSSLKLPKKALKKAKKFKVEFLTADPRNENQKLIFDEYNFNITVR